MTKVARYIIILDRMDDDEGCFGPSCTDWPRTELEGREQVARELQEAMEVTGQPAGFFRVIARSEIEYDGVLALDAPHEDAHQAAMQVLDNTRTY